MANLLPGEAGGTLGKKLPQLWEVNFLCFCQPTTHIFSLPMNF